MKKIINKTARFIIEKWDLSMQDLTLLGKIVLYIPIRINAVLTQLFYFSIFPLTCLYVWAKEIVEPLVLLFNLYLFNKN